MSVSHFVRYFNWLLMIMAGIALAALLSACGSGQGGSQGGSETNPDSSGSSAAPDQVTFKVDTSFLPKHGIFFAAAGKGFYEEEGLDVDIQPSTGSYDTSVAVGSGRTDFGFADFNTMVTARAEGLKVKQLAAIHASSPFAVVTLPKYNINSFEDLKGKRVAGEAAGSTTILFPRALEMCGMDKIRRRHYQCRPTGKDARFACWEMGCHPCLLSL